MKTVHGPEVYANKKHKGGNSTSGGSSGPGGGGGLGKGTEGSDEAGAGGQSSPSRSEDLHTKTPSLSSPSIKSESEANSPPSMMHQGSPVQPTNCADEAPGLTRDMNGPVDVVTLSEEPWNEEPEDLDIADLPVAIRAMVLDNP